MFSHIIDLWKRQMNDYINEIFYLNIFSRDELSTFEHGYRRRVEQIIQIQISILTLKIHYIQNKIKFYENYNSNTTHYINNI
jgi:hypothetical protein